jgi:hypothetical protein
VFTSFSSCTLWQRKLSSFLSWLSNFPYKTDVLCISISNLTQSFHSQAAYLIFEKATTRCNYKFVNASNWIVDGQHGMISSDTFYKVNVALVQKKFQLYMQDHDGDVEYSRLLFSTPIDVCKFSKGVQSNIFVKVTLENFNISIFTCPVLAGSHYKVLNYTVFDTFLPPMPIERRFKTFAEYHEKFSLKSRWTFLYSLEMLIRYKK